jgi:glycosyltransferase involved in cell wall biosynthesis
MSSDPLVSVVIPTRNRHALVLRAVRSALAQTLREIEIIVVIDCEPGCETVNALANLNEHRVRGIVLTEQVGGAEARNIGIRNARSPWIALLDDDDEWLPSKLQVQIEELRKYSGDKQPVVVCQHIYRAEGAADVVRPRRLPRTGEAPTDFMFDYLCYFQTSTFFTSKALMLQVPFTKDLPFFQDIDWFLRAMRKDDVQLLVVEQPLSIYYAPEKRATITSGVKWESRVEWGRANRHLMSKRAYSHFIVGSCVGPAVQNRAGLRGFVRLFYECVVLGSPTPKLLVLLLGTYLLRPGFRKKLRDRYFLRRVQIQVAPAQKSAA